MPDQLPDTLVDVVRDLTRSVFRLQPDGQVAVMDAGRSANRRVLHPELNRPYVLLFIRRSRQTQRHTYPYNTEGGLTFVARIGGTARHGYGGLRAPMSRVLDYSYVADGLADDERRLDPWPRNEDGERRLELTRDDMEHVEGKFLEAFEKVWPKVSGGFVSWDARIRFVEAIHDMQQRGGVPWEQVSEVLRQAHVTAGYLGVPTRTWSWARTVVEPERGIEALRIIGDAIERGEGRDQWLTHLSSNGFSIQNEGTAQAIA